MDVTVNTKDLRQALQAVTGHASPDPDNQAFNRVRFAVGPVNVEVFATQGFSCGLSIVSVIDNDDGEAGHWDMPPSAVKDLLTLFKVSKEVEEEACLRFSVDPEHVTVQDVSGLFPGKAVTLPRQPDHDYFPDIPGVIGEAVHAGPGALDGAMFTSGAWWAMFVAATKAYGQPLLLTPTAGARRRLLVTVGESFAGLLTGSSDEDRLAELERFREDWRPRLPDRPSTRGDGGDEDASRHLTVIDDPGEGDDPGDVAEWGGDE